MQQHGAQNAVPAAEDADPAQFPAGGFKQGIDEPFLRRDLVAVQGVAQVRTGEALGGLSDIGDEGAVEIDSQPLQDILIETVFI